MTRSSPPVPNARYYALFPENDEPDTCPNLRVTTPRYPNSHDGFTSGDLSADIARIQDEATLCGQRIASSPNEIQGMRAAMGRHERFHSELAADFAAKMDKANTDWRRALKHLNRKQDASFAEHDHRHGELQRVIKELKDSVLSCRSRKVAAKARVSQLRELASAGNPASPEMGTTPSKSGSRGDTSRTEQEAPLEPAPLNFAYRASDETNRFEPPPDFVVRWMSSSD